MRCALCGEAAELRKSHIIPEFIFGPLYDEDLHRFHVLSSEVRNRYRQKGLREKLLCDACEQRFSVHEAYVSRLMFSDGSLRPEPDGPTVVFRGVDYQALKLFQLSVLWRASVSQLDFFRHVSLGDAHEARLRALLLRNDPGEPWQYGCMMLVVFHEGLVVRDLVDQPIRRRVQGLTCYRFIFGGLAWLYFVGSQRSSQGLETASLDPSGTLRLFRKDLPEINDIAQFASTLARQGKV
jgi:hypothetical protein